MQYFKTMCSKNVIFQNLEGFALRYFMMMLCERLAVGNWGALS